MNHNSTIITSTPFIRLLGSHIIYSRSLIDNLLMTQRKIILVISCFVFVSRPSLAAMLAHYIHALCLVWVCGFSLFTVAVVSIKCSLKLVPHEFSFGMNNKQERVRSREIKK